MLDSESHDEAVPSPKPKRKQTWKAAERRSAQMLGEGAERVPVTGRTRGSAPDVRHPRWAIENKLRKALPPLIKGAMAQAIASIRGDQMALVILHETGQRYENDFAVLRMSDFLKINEILRRAEVESKSHQGVDLERQRLPGAPASDPNDIREPGAGVRHGPGPLHAEPRP